VQSKIGHAQGLYAPAAVRHSELLPGLHRPDQCELRWADDGRQRQRLSRFIASDAHTCRPLPSPPNTGDWHGFDFNRPGTGFRLSSSTQRRTHYRRERERVVGPSRKGNVPERLKGQARKPSLLLWGPRVRIPLPSQQSVSPVNSVNCRRSGPALGTTACRSS
jgi:hypothetical protein